MKCARLSLLVVCVLWAWVSADDEYTCEELREKYNGYSRMEEGGTKLKVGGSALLGIGVVGLGVGISVLANGEPAGLAGVMVGELGLGFGIPMLIAGGVVGGIGEKKRKEYQQRMCLVVHPRGIALSYNF